MLITVPECRRKIDGEIIDHFFLPILLTAFNVIPAFAETPNNKAKVIISFENDIGYKELEEIDGL